MCKSNKYNAKILVKVVQGAAVYHIQDPENQNPKIDHISDIVKRITKCDPYTPIWTNVMKKAEELFGRGNTTINSFVRFHYSDVATPANVYECYEAIEKLLNDMHECYLQEKNKVLEDGIYEKGFYGSLVKVNRC